MNFVYFQQKLVLNVNLMVITFRCVSKQSRPVLPLIFGKTDFVRNDFSLDRVFHNAMNRMVVLSPCQWHANIAQHNKNMIVRIVYHSKFTSRIRTVEANFMLLFVYLRQHIFISSPLKRERYCHFENTPVKINVETFFGKNDI